MNKSRIFRLPAIQKKNVIQTVFAACVTTDQDGKNVQNCMSGIVSACAFTASAGMQNTVKPFVSGIGNNMLDEKLQ